MKYYLDIDYHIISIDKEPLNYYYTDETSESKEESIFANMCSSALHLYKHEPQYQYEYEEDGSIKIDDMGMPVYALDDHGQKILTGWSTYPSSDYNILLSIQNEYEDNEKNKIELELALAEQYENNLKLEESLTNLQLALVELYENK